MDYRGAVVEDLDLLPALSVYPDTTLQDALDKSFEHNFSYLPVLSHHRRLLGYLTAEQLQSNPNTQDAVKNHYFRFKGKKEFIPMTPATPLSKLEEFFKSGHPFAVITDADRKFVLGVATPEDLEKYIKSRPQLS